MWSGLALLFVVTLHFVDSAKRDHPILSYFRRVDSNGNVIDRSKPEFDNQLSKPFLSRISRSDSGATLKVFPETVRNGGNVTVIWNGIIKPQEKDFIAFYCPVNDKPTHYLDYFYVTKSGTWAEGYGQYVVVVYNMRSNCVFKYYRGINASQLVAISNKISFSDGGNAAPLQGHISMTDKPTEMRVMWISGKTSKPTVQYGLTEAMELSTNDITVTTYTAESMCESPANTTGFWDPGYIYNGLLQALKPNTKYFYSYGTEEYMSTVSSFRTPLPAGNQTSYKFIIYGDMGIDPYPEGVTTADHVTKDITNDDDYRFVIHHGDVSYACGQAYIWEQWFKLVEPIATRLPYMVGIGNHEYDHVHGGEKDPSGAPSEGGFRPKWGNEGYDSGGECGVPMYKRFHMPDTGHSLWWYSFKYGLVHSIIISLEHDFSPGSRQYRWLESDLRNVDRQLTPWVIISGHRAMYCSEIAPGDYVFSLNMQRLFEDLLYKYKVDVAFWAHYHAYERMCKIYKGKCVDDGITHIMVGTAGRSVDIDIWFEKPWSVFHRNEYGYGRVTVANRTALYWEWVQNKSHKVMDSVWIYK